MATSISKLAVLITGDTTGLARATKDGERIVQRFNSNVTQRSALTGKGNLAQSLLIGGGASPLIGLAARGGPLALATLGLAAFARAGANAAAELRELRGEVSQWDRLKQSFGDLSAEKLGGVGSVFSTLFRSLADTANMLAATPLLARFGSTDQSGIAKERAALIEKNRLLKEQAAIQKQLAEEELKRQEAARRAMEEMKQRANIITEALRTPSEIFADTLEELRELTQAGFLGMETYTRGVKRAADELRSATKRATEFKNAGTVTVGAAERFTSSGQSAIVQARMEQQRQFELEKQQLAAEKEQVKIMEQVRLAIERKKPVVIKKVDL